MFSKLMVRRIVLVCAVAVLAGCASTQIDSKTEALINQMPQISQIGYGYSSMFTGSQFLPDPDSGQVHALMLGAEYPKNSEILEQIVRRGVCAVPALLKHLDDTRTSEIPPLTRMMWVSFADEYDYNRRTRIDIPTGVNKDFFGHDKSSRDIVPFSHIISVGDLCFVALGQIVNRSFNASRFQATAGLVINSPTESKQLCEVVRRDFKGLTKRKHRELLVQDFILPDFEDRRNDACSRLAFYYPEVSEPLVLKQLSVPTFDVFKINDFVRDELYQKKSPAGRREIFKKFIQANGQAFSDGVLLQLFDDLSVQEADEQNRLSPPLEQKYDARASLILLYGFADGVGSTNKPYVATWNDAEQARFIKALGTFKSQKIDAAVHAIFSKITDNDYLAISCMNRLIGKGYDAEIRQYCERRIPVSKYESTGLNLVLLKLESKSLKDTRPKSMTNENQSVFQ